MYTVSQMKWDGETDIYSAFICYSDYIEINVLRASATLKHVLAIINYAFNHSNLHLFWVYVVNFIKICRMVSEINVLRASATLKHVLAI